ncbi:MAG: hypothetical protein L0229_17800 [Blastocatellia bacterium]|nr:hypothetical protein [Blastocatellia bacterium]
MKLPEFSVRRPITIYMITSVLVLLGAMSLAGLCACPTDALPEVRNRADYICIQAGGHGAFREFAEFILAAQFNS